MRELSASRVLRRKMRRQAVGDWKQFLAIIMMGSIAMTLFVGLLSNAQSLSGRVNSFYESSSVPDIWVVNKSYKEADEAYLKSILEEGDKIDKRFQITAKLESGASYCIVTDGMPTLSHPVDVIAKDETLTDDDFFYIDQGIWAGNTNAKDFKLDLGSDAQISFTLFGSMDLPSSALNVLDRYVLPGATALHREEEITFSSKINGVMTFGENIQQASYYPSAFLMSKSRFETAMTSLLEAHYTEGGVNLIRTALGGEIPPMNEYLIKLKDTSRLKDVEAKIRDYYADKSYFVEVLDRSLNPWSIAAETEIQEATQLTFVFPVVFFFVALLVILTTASQIIIKERTQIGTMKAIGLSKREIYTHYLSLVFSLTTLSSIIGFVVGPLLIPYIMARKYNILYTLPARSLFVFPLWQALLAYVVFVGLALLVAFLSCRKEVKLLPVESMRAAPVEYHSIGKIRSNKPHSARFLSIKMAFRNIIVSKYKSMMVVVGVLGCTALLVCGFGIDDTLNHCIDTDLKLFYSSDLTCTYSSVQREQTPAFASNPYVKSYDQFYENNIKISTSNTSMSGNLYLLSDDHPFVHVDIPENTVIISLKVHNELGLNAGDEVSFSHNGNLYHCKIGAVYETFILNGIMAFHKDFAEIPGVNGFWVDAVDGVSADELKASIYQDLGEDKIDKARTREETEEMIASVMSGIAVMTNAVKSFAIALAIVVLYNLALLNFRERMRDIATMKVLGFSLIEISYSLIFETLTLTLLGVLLGFAVGYPFMYLVLYVNRVALVEFLYHINPATYLIAFGLTFVVNLFINIYLGFMTRKVKMVESLKSVE